MQIYLFSNKKSKSILISIQKKNNENKMLILFFLFFSAAFKIRQHDKIQKYSNKLREIQN